MGASAVVEDQEQTIKTSEIIDNPMAGALPSNTDRAEAAYELVGAGNSDFNSRAAPVEHTQRELEKVVIPGNRRAADNQERAQKSFEHDAENFDWFDRTFTDVPETTARAAQNCRESAKEHRKHADELEQHLGESKQLVLQARKCEEEARKLAEEAHASGQPSLIDQANLKQAEANDLLRQSSELINGPKIPDSERRQREDAAIRAELDESIKNLGTAVTVARTTRNVCVVAAATIATGGTALVVEGGALVVGSTAVAVGTATGTGVGAVLNTVEEVGHVACGNKTAEQAQDDWVDHTLQDAKSSLFASGSTVTALGATRVLGLAGEGAVALSGTGKVAAGSIAGATGSTVSSSLTLADEYHQLSEQFNQSVAGQTLTPEDRAARFDRFLEEHDFTVASVSKRFGAEVTAGTLGGLLGAGSNLAQSVVESSGAKLAVKAAEVAGNAVVGVSTAAIDGDVTADEIAQQLGASVIGDAVGSMAECRGSKNDVGDLRPNPDSISKISNIEAGPDPQISAREATNLIESKEDLKSKEISRRVEVESQQNRSSSPVSELEVGIAEPESFLKSDPIDSNFIVETLPFNGRSADQIRMEVPPPINIPDQVNVFGPERAAGDYNRVNFHWKETFECPGSLHDGKVARVEVYFHDYPEHKADPANWRINVKLGGQQKEYVAVRPIGSEEGPYKLGDFDLVPRKEWKAQELSLQTGKKIPADLIDTKELTQERINSLPDLVDSDRADAINLMQRGHFVPGEY